MVSPSLVVKIRKFECGLPDNNKRNLWDMTILFEDSVRYLPFKVLHRVQMTKWLNFGRWMVSCFRKTKVTMVLFSELIALTQERLFLLVMIAALSCGKTEHVVKLSKCQKQSGV